MKKNAEFKKIQKIKKKIEDIKQKLVKFSKNKDEIIRIESLEALGLFYDGDIDRTIMKGLQDKDYLVRISALDNIILPQDLNKVYKKIAKLLKDKKMLVRAYAVDALAYNNAVKYRKKIKKLLKKNINDRLKVSVYAALVKFGEIKYLKKLLNLLKHKDYVIRCAVANSLYCLANSNYNNLILKKLKKVYNKEQTKAAKSCILEAIEYIEAFVSLEA